MTDERATNGAEPTLDRNPPDRIGALRLAGAVRTLLRCHQQMGIEHYPLSPALQRFLRASDHGGRPARPPERGSKQAVEAIPAARAGTPQPEPSGKAGPALQALCREIDGCRRCSLATAGQGVVRGSGATDAVLLVVGDYSAQSAGFSAATLFGAAEDVLLWNMMRAIGLTPHQVYVTNAVKCCPRPAAAPAADSIQCCRGYLMREIELVRPKVVCVMGEIAVRALLDTRETLVRMRGRFHPLPGRQGKPADDPLQVMATFHPRLLLDNAELKKAAWQDLQLVQRRLRSS